MFKSPSRLGEFIPKQKTKRFWDLESGLVGQNINIAIDTYRVTEGIGTLRTI